MSQRRLHVPAFILVALMFGSALGPLTISNTFSHSIKIEPNVSISQDDVLSTLEAVLVYDSESDLIIRYGGWSSIATSPGYSDVVEYDDETWAFDLNANEWTNMTTSANPGPKAGCGAAYDSLSDRVIIYGGQVSETSTTPEELYSSDTWSYDYNSNSWTNMSPINSPGIRYGTGMVYDSESDIIILFGGINYPSLNGYHVQQTWAYDFESNNWTNLQPDIQPIGRHHMGIVYDVESDRVILFGGYVSSAFDAASSETWAYDYNSNSWELMEPDRSPAGRFYGSMSYDNQTDVAILYGGASEFSNNAELGDTWAYDYNSDDWVKMVPDPHPPARWRHAISYDIESETHVLFGGSFGNIFGGEASNDVCWTYDYPSDEWVNKDSNFDPDLPGPPENPLVLYDGYAMFITWEPPSNDTGYAISGYNVYRGTELGQLALLAETDSVLIYPDNSIIPGETYYYEITAVTPVGEGEASEVFSCSIPAPLPVLEFIVGGVAVLSVIIGIIAWKRRRTLP